MTRRLRISAISYLNTAPLMWDFEHERRDELASDFEISYTVPSQCAEALLAGEADIGIIPSITFATIPDLIVIPDVAIAAKNTVRSILLVTKRPLEDVRSVALDTSSRTSVALTRILFARLFQPGSGQPHFTPMPPDIPQMLASCDAGLLIGDPALRIQTDEYAVYDLAEEWRRFTGKPFVFAFWAVRLAALNDMRRGLDLGAIFSNSRDHGLLPEALDEIARVWAPRVGISEGEVRSYLTGNIHYRLDSENLQGLELFYQFASEDGLIAEPPSMRFLGTRPLRFAS